jgi:hypothetical protein
VLAILQGNARPGKHEVDALHLSEAAETGCGYFITHDKRMLDKRGDLHGALPPTLNIVSLEEFFEIFDRYAAEISRVQRMGADPITEGAKAVQEIAKATGQGMAVE